LGAYSTPCLLWRLTQDAEARLRFGLTSVWSDKDFVVQIFQKKSFFAPITFKVFLKHLAGYKESIGILGNQIRP